MPISVVKCHPQFPLGAAWCFTPVGIWGITWFTQGSELEDVPNLTALSGRHHFPTKIATIGSIYQ